jgi:hypothetical protein
MNGYQVREQLPPRRAAEPLLAAAAAAPPRLRSLTPAVVLALQSTAGNAAVSRLISGQSPRCACGAPWHRPAADALNVASVQAPPAVEAVAGSAPAADRLDERQRRSSTTLGYQSARGGARARIARQKPRASQGVESRSTGVETVEPSLAGYVHVGAFHVFLSDPAQVIGRLAMVKPYLSRMPQAHYQVLDPMFVVERLPHGRSTGGGYFKPDEIDEWLGKERRTGVSDEALQRLVISSNAGIIAFTRTSMMQNIAHFTVLHEAAHSVDHHLGIVPPGATVDDFRGIRYQDGSVGEYAAEAYSRYVINPSRVCRQDELPAGEGMQACSTRIADLLHTAPAF